ncbi:PbsX family transcriptional regulator [Escherichia coli]|uniref:PapB/FocB family fimbrial expression transcriptional regulator n=1 Tax=Escherichia coli TaxID=562 RepID=UPI00132BD589|nr:PbsX family transcriptional regulator [Escherichia coli]MVX75772.1 PbsX family transcriptional regulator [Escherichia coli]MZQ01648.1 PbsX family transcriptional regulator [Escherichia coli]MZQ21204.1 PbsX family transcriptional regulator [Escherichia coli]MZQ30965.1 PbsX family transcriptional regulator [Escherichia coli]
MDIQNRNKTYLNLLTSKHSMIYLSRGGVGHDHFWLLMELTSIRSEKMIRALYDYFVSGYLRNEICDMHGVSQSNLSLSIKKIQHTYKIVKALEHLN